MSIAGAGAASEPGKNYGQGFPSGNCANFFLKFLNQSSAEVVQIVFAPASGKYTNYKDYQQGRGYATVEAAPPAPARLSVSIPAYGDQEIRFQVCTSTPPPGGDYEYSTDFPSTFSWKWVSGQTASGPTR